MVLLLAFLAVLFWVSVQKGLIGTAAASYTLGNYWDILADPFTYRALFNTLIFALTTTTVALLIGLPIAWLVERTTLPAKPMVYTIMTLGLLIPGIYVAMGWTFIAHPRIGIINNLLRDLFGLVDSPINVGTPMGMGFVQALNLAPLAFILTSQMFRSMNPSLEEAAQSHGLGFGRTMWRITLPLAMPGILAACIYIFTLALAVFDIPAVLGLGNRVYLLSTYIYVKANPPSGMPEWGITASLGVIMIAVALALTWWYGQVLRQGHRYQIITGKGYRPTLIDLRRFALPAWSFILLYGLLSKLLPLLLVAFVAFAPYPTTPTPEMMRELSFDNYQRINWDLVLRGLRHTAILVVVVPTVVLLFAVCISWLVVRSRSRIRYLLEFGAFLPHALPGIIFAIGALLLGLFVFKGWLPIYGTVWLIALVYVVERIAFATRATNGSLLQVHKELEEAAYVGGLSQARTIARVIVPLLRPTLLAVWLWSALLVARELTVAVFLTAQDNITLPAVVWSLWFAGGMTEASAITLLQTIILAPLVMLYWAVGGRSGVPGR
jgi:iron(III) transport system permease protein